ncbi:hypothetical protein JI664_04800 [Rhodobacter sp. NTK016B]|uniref:hypothetical protein n=1 Tax=Rhodobacter sp. NTK016B TaxID=2759676 RepID=UPI001A8C3C2F|nr:hypothetical protein [Rhodobacter sp. NTK016B]MBN8291277.1 hypothetical protein [Rhodobacter sp. NTK016B]
MTSVLSPISPTMPPTIRDTAGSPPPSAPGNAPTNAAPVTATVTARAPQPVNAVNRPEIARNQTLPERPVERPVGPPPAFDINVLQDIRSRLNAPPEMPPAAKEAPPEPTAREVPDDEPPGSGDEADPPREAPDDRPASKREPVDLPDEVLRSAPVLGTGPEPPHALDKKV